MKESSRMISEKREAWNDNSEKEKHDKENLYIMIYIILR